MLHHHAGAGQPGSDLIFFSLHQKGLFYLKQHFISPGNLGRFSSDSQSQGEEKPEEELIHTCSGFLYYSAFSTELQFPSERLRNAKSSFLVFAQ